MHCIFEYEQSWAGIFIHVRNTDIGCFLHWLVCHEDVLNHSSAVVLRKICFLDIYCWWTWPYGNVQTPLRPCALGNNYPEAAVWKVTASACIVWFESRMTEQTWEQQHGETISMERRRELCILILTKRRETKLTEQWNESCCMLKT